MKVSKTWWFMLVQSIYRHLDPNPSFVNLSRRMTRCHNSTITVITDIPQRLARKKYSLSYSWGMKPVYITDLKVYI